MFIWLIARVLPVKREISHRQNRNSITDKKWMMSNYVWNLCMPEIIVLDLLPCALEEMV